jgi:phytoene dehydrogenase-like protein
MANSIIIVGAGIAGLSAGCYARMNGYQATLFEMHNIPGGLCTAWTRKGYTWDISMHLLAGSKSGPLYQMWRELGAVQQRRFVYHDVLTSVEDGEKRVAFCADMRRLEEQMLAISPADAARIREFTRIFGGKSIINLMPLDAPGTAGKLGALKMLFGMLPLMGLFRKYGKKTLREFADGFQSPFLRAAIPFILDHPGWPMPGYPMMGVTGFHTSALTEAGVPIGGSRAVIDDIAGRFGRLGGELRCRSKVTEVIVENDRAVGVRLEDGTEHRADIVLWAADGRTLLFDLLGGRYLTDELRRRYREWQVVRPMVHVMLGLTRDMTGEPCRLTFKIDQPITVGETAFPWIYFMHHGFDPTSAPEGKTAAEVWYDTEYDYWEKLHQDKPAYEAEKGRIADETIAALDKRWPGLAADVEVVDVPTPVTYHRYTGNWQGSVDGWYITPQNMGAPAILTLPGLYMAGQWTAPFTGTVIAALTGRQAVQLLCRAEKKTFHTTTEL